MDKVKYEVSDLVFYQALTDSLKAHLRSAFPVVISSVLYERPTLLLFEFRSGFYEEASSSAYLKEFFIDALCARQDCFGIV